MRSSSQRRGPAPRRVPRRRRPVRQPVRVLHHLDGLLTLASLAAHSSGALRRRQRQRLALTQRLLDPLPPELAQPHRMEVIFWRILRWGTPGLLVAWWLQS